MELLAEARRRLTQATGLPAILTAASDAFVVRRLARIHEQEDRAGPGFRRVRDVRSVGRQRPGRHRLCPVPADERCWPRRARTTSSGWTRKQPSWRQGPPPEVGELALMPGQIPGARGSAGVSKPGDRKHAVDGARHAADRGLELLTGTAVAMSKPGDLW